MNIKKAIALKAILIVILGTIVFAPILRQEKEKPCNPLLTSAKITLAPNRKSVLIAQVANCVKKVIECDIARKTIRTIDTKNLMDEGEHSFSSLGRDLVFTGRKPRMAAASIYRRELHSAAVFQVTNESYNDHSPVFSVDNKAIYFSRDFRYKDSGFAQFGWDQSDLCIVDLDGNLVQRLTSQQYGWLTNLTAFHNHIYFVAMPENTSFPIKNLYRFDPRTPSLAPQIVRRDVIAYAISPGGEKLAYATNQRQLFLGNLLNQKQASDLRVTLVLDVVFLNENTLLVLQPKEIVRVSLPTMKVEKFLELK